MDDWKKELIDEPNEVTTPSVDQPSPAHQYCPSHMCCVACIGKACDNCRIAKRKYFASLKKTAILQLIGGCLLVCMGIVAIILMAQWSYFATPIWSGLLIFGSTGVIGIYAASSEKLALVQYYLVMSLISSVMGLALFVLYICALSFENGRDYGQDYHDGSWCQPATYSSLIYNCSKSLAARELFDSLIMLTGLFLLILAIVPACLMSMFPLFFFIACCCPHTPSTVKTTTTANQTVVVPGNQYEQQVGDFPETGQRGQAYPPTDDSNIYIIHAAPPSTLYGTLGPSGRLSP